MMILANHNAIIAFTDSNFGDWSGTLLLDILLKHIIPMIEENKVH